MIRPHRTQQNGVSTARTTDSANRVRVGFKTGSISLQPTCGEIDIGNLRRIRVTGRLTEVHCCDNHAALS